ncbi:MAG: site-2 protease family protein [Chloroflexota bacterium]|nr:site-2 protease family protein [Chloroflexota bacterium]
MLNETASSVEDRPYSRPTPRHPPPGGVPPRLSDELRQMVMSVLTIDHESALGDDAEAAQRARRLGIPTGEPRVLGIFEGHLTLDSEAAYAKIDNLLATINALPLFREIDDKQVVIVLQGRVQVQPRSPWLNIALFVATLLSVLLLGYEMAVSEIATIDIAQARDIIDRGLIEIWRGFPYAISILLILGAHELGHYFAARHHKLAVTLPYFIPAPFISAIGTFGAFIQLREPMRNRKVLLDVGAAGPLMGLIFAVPILLIGLATSQVDVIRAGTLEGNSLLYALAKVLTFGRFLPDGQVDVYVNQLAWAGWTGLLVTGLNLIPIGQLDGGHILYSLIGDRARILYYPILIGMVALVLVTNAWFFWLILLFLFGRVYATPLDMITRLDARRKIVGIVGLIVFAVTFVPLPFSDALAASAPVLPPGDSVFGGLALLPLAVGLVVWWTGRRRH